MIDAFVSFVEAGIRLADYCILPVLVIIFVLFAIILRPTKRAPDVCHSCGAKEHYTEKVCSVCGTRR